MLFRLLIITFLFTFIVNPQTAFAKNINNEQNQTEKTTNYTVESDYLSNLQVNIQELKSKVKKNLPDKFEFMQLINSNLQNNYSTKQSF